MLRRALTLIVALGLLIILAVGGMFLRVPYLVAGPGLALNTLGQASGEPVIQISGHESYEHDGGLSMVTVQYYGGPGNRIDLFTALSAWLSPEQAVLPEEALFPPDRSVEEVTEAQSLQMSNSQEAAVAAALNQLDISYSEVPLIVDVTEGMPAEGKLRPGDVITEVGGEKVRGQEEAVRLVQDREPGDPVDVAVERDGETKEVTLTTEASEDAEEKPVVGVLIGTEFKFPFKVDISVGEIGGPSAGMMFALGVMDHLDSKGITGGHHVAGTGTIDPNGTVGGVSGVAQKMVSAQSKDAEYFLVPSESCSQTADSSAEDMRVVKIEKLGDAVRALESIRTGEGVAQLPRC